MANYLGDTWGSTASGGSQGAQGVPGTPGKDGSKGDKGDIGVGTKGDKGDPGVGTKGDKGDTGVGTKGDKGDTGVGTKGDKGDNGTNGVDGRNGTNGSNASSGGLYYYSARLDGTTAYSAGESLRYLTAPISSLVSFQGLTFLVPYTGAVDVFASAAIGGGSVSVKRTGSASDSIFLFGVMSGNTQTAAGNCIYPCVGGDILTVIANTALSVYNGYGTVCYKMR